MTNPLPDVASLDPMVKVKALVKTRIGRPGSPGSRRVRIGETYEVAREDALVLVNRGRATLVVKDPPKPRKSRRAAESASDGD